MKLPVAEPGLIVRYEYLWHRRSETGADTGDKDRPVLILNAHRSGDESRVVLLPITHTSPTDDEDAVEIPPKVKAHLGLDDARSWVVISEGNIDIWPSPDIRRVPASSPIRFDYGFLPPRLFQTIRNALSRAACPNGGPHEMKSRANRIL